MKHPNLILILSILVFASCTEIKKEDLKGNWIAYPSEYDELNYREIKFGENQVELIDDHLFKEIGNYQVENGKIRIELDRDDVVIETKIQKLEVDTLLIFDSLTFYRNDGITNSNFDDYELIGIPTNKFLSEERSLFHLIHFYKSGEEVQIRYGDKKATFEDIPLFLEGGHSKPKVILFIGKGITLKDLKRIYYRLASIRQLTIWLGTKREGIADTHVFKDKIEIWWNDLANHLANSKIKPPPPPPPPIEFTSRERYLKSGGKIVKISNTTDLQKISDLTDNERHVISIRSNLPLEDYVELKKTIGEKKKLNQEIITEIQ